MGKRRLFCFIIMMIFATICSADTHRSLQAVDEFGEGTHPYLSPATKVTVEGIILNRSEYMVNIADGNASQWQIYIQGEDSDHAGTAVYMRKNYFDPLKIYTDQQWADELFRISNDPCGNYEFRPGDRVKVTGLLKFYNGKTNINERHSINPDYDFTIDLVDPAAGLPEPELITLDMVKDSSDDFIFNTVDEQNPSTWNGCEWYQGILVRVNDVNISAGTWGMDNELTIKDSSGLTFPLKLGRGPGFSKFPQPTGQIDVIGIFDQESQDWTIGYRIWVVNYDGNESVLTDNCGLNGYLAGDINKDCVVDLGDFAALSENWLKCSNLSYDECTIP